MLQRPSVGDAFSVRALVLRREPVHTKTKAMYKRKSVPKREDDVGKLTQELCDLTDSMFAEGILDDQFTQLQQLQDESNPEFVGEVIGLFFEDSAKLLTDLEQEVNEDPVDFKKVDAHVHQFKGSSSSIGAARVKAICIEMRAHCDEESKDKCLTDLGKIKEEFDVVKGKLELMMSLEKKILEKGGQLPTIEG